MLIHLQVLERAAAELAKSAGLSLRPIVLHTCGNNSTPNDVVWVTAEKFFLAQPLWN